MRLLILSALGFSVFGVTQQVRATGCWEKDQYELGQKVSTYQATGQYDCLHAATIKGVDYWKCGFSTNSPYVDVFRSGTYTYYSADQKPNDNVTVQVTIEIYEAMEWNPCAEEAPTYKPNGIFKKLIDGNIEMSTFGDRNHL